MRRPPSPCDNRRLNKSSERLGGSEVISVNLSATLCGLAMSEAWIAAIFPLDFLGPGRGFPRGRSGTGIKGQITILAQMLLDIPTS